jgi:hypothetical protein
VVKILDVNDFGGDIARVIEVATEVAAGTLELCPCCGSDDDGCYCRFGG